MNRIFQRLDPRARILTIVAVIAIVASTPPAVLRPFAAYAALAILLVLTSRASGFYLTLRCLAASPFLLLAAGLLALERGAPAGASVLCKGYLAALLLAMLTATTPLSELLWALREMRAPHVLNIILGMMYRYTNLLGEEYARMERARNCRTVRPLGWNRISIYGHQFGNLILRSWDRADRVHAAMLSRGFTGAWPAIAQRRFTARDAAFIVLTAALFLAPRLFVPR
ncbi:MAG: energy-coupling factor transporter transmembrane protein EcfT [Bryobacterales bacterium]|nr:energy-coupling factor transporter transmembrane protein EcfT [Bryobacterales bacterium]